MENKKTDTFANLVSRLTEQNGVKISDILDRRDMYTFGQGDRTRTDLYLQILDHLDMEAIVQAPDDSNVYFSLRDTSPSEVIRMILANRKISQRDFAEQLGIGFNGLRGRLYTNRHSMQAGNFLDMLDALGARVEISAPGSLETEYIVTREQQ